MSPIQVLVIVLMLLRIPFLLAERAVMGPCPEKPNQVKNINSCNFREGQQKVVPKGKSGVTYGNAGYFRFYGTELYIGCVVNYTGYQPTQMKLIIEEIKYGVASNVPIAESYCKDLYNIGYFQTSLTNPAPGEVWRCKCVANDTESETMSSSEVLMTPDIGPCKHETCTLHQDNQLCYENITTGAIQHTWSKSDTMFGSDCPEVVNLFEKDCTKLGKNMTTLESKSAVQFYLDGHAIDSGSLFNILEEENLTMSTSCLSYPPTNAELKCHAIIWAKNVPHRKQVWKETKIKAKPLTWKIVSTENSSCLQLQIDIRHADLISWMPKTIIPELSMIIIGCQNASARPKKQVEFYLNILPPITYSMVNETYQCSLKFSGNTLMEPAVEWSVNQCFCNFTLVSCNPQVTIKNVNHSFQCRATAASSSTTSTSLDKVVNPNIKTTEAAAIPIWVFVVIAAIMTLLTVIFIMIATCPRNKSIEMNQADPQPQEQPTSVSQKTPNIILDESLFQNPNQMEMENESKSTELPKGTLSLEQPVYKGLPAGAQHEEGPVNVRSLEMVKSVSPQVTTSSQ